LDFSKSSKSMAMVITVTYSDENSLEDDLLENFFKWVYDFSDGSMDVCFYNYSMAIHSRHYVYHDADD
jgi:hypothetical protein